VLHSARNGKSRALLMQHDKHKSRSGTIGAAFSQKAFIRRPKGHCWAHFLMLLQARETRNINVAQGTDRHALKIIYKTRLTILSPQDTLAAPYS